MSRRKKIVAPECPPPTPPQDTCDQAVAMCPPDKSPRERAADLVKAEALYLVVRDSDLFIPWDVKQAYQAAVARCVTEMRLGS